MTRIWACRTQSTRGGKTEREHHWRARSPTFGRLSAASHLELQPDPVSRSCASPGAYQSCVVRGEPACARSTLPPASVPARSSSRRSRATWQTRRGLVVSRQRFRLGPWFTPSTLPACNHRWFVSELAAGILDLGPHVGKSANALISGQRTPELRDFAPVPARLLRLLPRPLPLVTRAHGSGRSTPCP